MPPGRKLKIKMENKMSHYVLVHGAFEGSWSWENITPELTKNGHEVTVVDLPGSPGNKRIIPEVTMEGYVDAVVGAISKLERQVVLVGHSMAGAVISQVAELIPEKIERLVYVTAFLLKDGDSVLEAMQRDAAGQFLPRLAFADDQSSATSDEATWREVAFHDVDEPSILEALPLLRGPQATEPFMAKVNVTDERFGTVPKTYIRTDIDKMLTPTLQDEMVENWKVDQIHVLNSGHFPAMSVPKQLASAML